MKMNRPILDDYINKYYNSHEIISQYIYDLNGYCDDLENEVNKLKLQLEKYIGQKRDKNE